MPVPLPGEANRGQAVRAMFEEQVGWAAEAGVGFTGKNACLIDPRRGSWTSLGVVLTTAALAPDAPVVENCGTCALCIDACPTKAITSPGVCAGPTSISLTCLSPTVSVSSPEKVRVGGVWRIPVQSNFEPMVS